MSKILLAGNDFRLLTTRAAVLAKTGAATVCCSVAEALKVLEAEKFDLIVLCHSMSDNDSGRIIELACKCQPDTRILLVVADAGAGRSYKNAALDSTNSFEPEHLLRRTIQLLQQLPDHHFKETSRTQA
jgi:CheY-like chemotaxis protein